MSDNEKDAPEALDTEDQNLQEKDPYSLSSLTTWLELDEWPEKSGFLLLADIEPKGADIDWYGSRLGESYAPWEDLSLKNAQLLSEAGDDIFYLLDHHMSPQKLKEMAEADIEIGSGQVADIEEKALKLKDAENRLRRIVRLWEYKKHPSITYPRMPVSYFLAWAKNNEIDIPWLSWAQEKELLPDEAAATFTESRPNEAPAPSAKRIEARNNELQSAANELATQWENEGRKSFSKREIAEKLATTEGWTELTASRIERIIKKNW